MAATILPALPELPESELDRKIRYIDRLVSEVMNADLRFCECGKIATVTHLPDERAYCLSCYHGLRAHVVQKN